MFLSSQLTEILAFAGSVGTVVLGIVAAYFKFREKKEDTKIAAVQNRAEEIEALGMKIKQLANELSAAKELNKIMSAKLNDCKKGNTERDLMLEKMNSTLNTFKICFNMIIKQFEKDFVHDLDQLASLREMQKWVNSL